MIYLHEKAYDDVAIVDLNKALDTLPHDRLLPKLSHYRISGNIDIWDVCVFIGSV